MMGSRTAGLAAAALLQIAVLCWLVADRIALLRSTEEIELPVVPVDPRDLFRGDYVILGYDIGSIAAPKDVLARTDLAQPFYVRIEKGADGRFAGTLAGPDRPAVGPGQHAALARARHAGKAARQTAETAGRLPVRYGIESYFIPEGTGRALETQATERRLATLVAVGQSGELAIKGLLVDGKLVHREPEL